MEGVGRPRGALEFHLQVVEGDGERKRDNENKQPGGGKGQSGADRQTTNCVPCCHWSAPLLNQRPALPVKVTRCSMGIHRSGHVIAQPGADWRREEGVGGV